MPRWRCTKCRLMYPVGGDTGRGEWLWPEHNLTCVSAPLCRTCALPEAQAGLLGATQIPGHRVAAPSARRAVFAARGRRR